MEELEAVKQEVARNEKVLELFHEDAEVIGFRSGKNHPWRKTNGNYARTLIKPPFNWIDPDGSLRRQWAINNIASKRPKGLLKGILEYQKEMLELERQGTNERAGYIPRYVDEAFGREPQSTGNALPQQLRRFAGRR